MLLGCPAIINSCVPFTTFVEEEIAPGSIICSRKRTISPFGVSCAARLPHSLLQHTLVGTMCSIHMPFERIQLVCAVPAPCFAPA
jgi:hypothetical protein